MEMPRAIWSGSISFGLVNAPVKMYSAIDEHDLELHLVHEKDGSRIGYEKVCKKEGKPVPADEIVKAYEVSDGDLVYLTPDDFEAAGEEGYRAIEVLDFVPHDEIDPIVYQRTYYLGPADGAEKVYALLVRAMDESGLSAIVRYVFHDRQQLGCLRIREGVITLESMYFADEIRPVDGIAPKGQRVDKNELELAQTLIDRFTSTFKHDRYRDEYTDRLLSVVKRKRKGEGVHAAATGDEREEPVDLFEALRASVESAKSKNGRSQRKATKRRKPRAHSRS
jgi:DNA end-binding protein Ku